MTLHVVACPKCGADLWCSVYEVMGFDYFGPDHQPVESVVRIFCKGHPQHTLGRDFRDVDTAVRFYRRYFGGATRTRRRAAVPA